MKAITLIHASKPQQGDGNILLLPMGLNALANFLNENNYATEILHLQLEKAVDPQFNLIKYLKFHKRQIIGFDLHWHYQTFSVLTAVRNVKSMLPESIIILGGFTASFFARDIMSQFPDVDFVIKGDAEIPLLRLTQTLSTQKNNTKRFQILYGESKKI